MLLICRLNTLPKALRNILLSILSPLKPPVALLYVCETKAEWRSDVSIGMCTTDLNLLAVDVSTRPKKSSIFIHGSSRNQQRPYKACSIFLRVHALGWYMLACRIPCQCWIFQVFTSTGAFSTFLYFALLYFLFPLALFISTIFYLLLSAQINFVIEKRNAKCLYRLLRPTEEDDILGP